ncbi:MAG: GGDEF domain-containing protein [Aquabacterium sp.]
MRWVGRWLAGFARRIVERRDSTSVLVLIEATLPILLLLLGMQAWATQQADIRGLYRQDWITPSLWAQAALMGWLVCLGLMAWWRRMERGPQPWLVQLTLIPTGLGVLLLCLGHGLEDTPMSMVLLAELVFARALFSLRQLVPALLLCMLTAFGVEALYMGGHLPYAPLLTAPLYQGSQMHAWWTVWARIVLAMASLPLTALLFLMAITLHRHRRMLETLVRTDGLTGLYNRREFQSRLDREAHRQARTGRPLSVVLFDVDHFKRVNDAFGHPVGDEVLSRIGLILRTSTRENVDTAARYGGEEFVLLLPETDLSGAQQVAEKISAKLRAEVFTVGAHSFRVTQSAGVAEVVGGDTQWALRVADRNLYEAKEAGRDRVVASVASVASARR